MGPTVLQSHRAGRWYLCCYVTRFVTQQHREHPKTHNSYLACLRHSLSCLLQTRSLMHVYKTVALMGDIQPYMLTYGTAWTKDVFSSIALGPIHTSLANLMALNQEMVHLERFLHVTDKDYTEQESDGTMKDMSQLSHSEFFRGQARSLPEQDLLRRQKGCRWGQCWP